MPKAHQVKFCDPGRATIAAVKNSMKIVTHNTGISIAKTLYQWWQRLSRNGLLWLSVGMVVIWRIALEMANQLAAKSHFAANLNQWSRWDGGWYKSVIERGYEFGGSIFKEENIAFFPAFPKIVHAISMLVPLKPFYAGLVLNIVITVANVYIIMLLARFLVRKYGAEKHQNRIAILSALVFLLYPASFFFAAFYAESLLVLGTLGAVYFAITKRLWLSVPFMIIATASKVIGALAVATVAVIVLEQWLAQTRRQPFTLIKNWAITALGMGGLLGYMLFLWIRFGDPLLFYSIQKAWGRNNEGFFVTEIARIYYAKILEPGYFGNKYGYLLNILYMILPFILTAAALYAWRRYKTYWPLVPGILAWLVPASTGVLGSLNRYALIAAALIPFGVMWLYKCPPLLYALIAASGILMIVFATAFLHNIAFMG